MSPFLEKKPRILSPKLQVSGIPIGREGWSGGGERVCGGHHRSGPPRHHGPCRALNTPSSSLFSRFYLIKLPAFLRLKILRIFSLFPFLLVPYLMFQYRKYPYFILYPINFALFNLFNLKLFKILSLCVSLSFYIHVKKLRNKKSQTKKSLVILVFLYTLLFIVKSKGSSEISH